MYYYDQIIEKEKYWSYLIEKGLLNVYSLKCSNGVKDFYIAKIRELNGYLASDSNSELKNVVKQLERIVKKIDLIIVKHNSGSNSDVKELLDYFLINSKDSNNLEDDLDIDSGEIRQEISKAFSNYLTTDIPPMENISIE